MFKWLTDLFNCGDKVDLNKDEPLTNEKAYDLIVDGRKKYKLNGVKVPEQVKTRSLAALAAHPKFTAPKTVDLRDYCTQTENQGSLPYCAAYTAAGFAENVMWRRDDYITQIDPVSIYKRAKELDGDPGEGTSLTAVLEVLLEKKYFDPNICQIQVIYDNSDFESSIKYAIHKFGCILLACDITEEWYLCGTNKTAITGKNNNRSVGGHAILCCGYNRDGVIIHNSWGEEWGAYGYALITWEALRKQFLYAAVLTNCLNNLKLN